MAGAIDPEPERRRSLRAVGVLALLGLGALGLAWQLSSDRPPASGTGNAMREAYAGLCETRTLAQASPGVARDQFFGQVHSPLHDIAREVQGRDRARTARFLEAKNDVEQAFNDGTTGRPLTGALDRLLAQTGEALRLLGVTTSTCNPS